MTALTSMFTKTYELSLTRNYVSRWGMAHAVRELIQNALDSESPFVWEIINQGDGNHSLVLNSEFTVLAAQTLLLGATSKADSKDSIGSFGEGYKIALLVLTRMGYDVEMRNGHNLWKPRFKFNAKFGEELLVIDETGLPDKTNKGLTFIVNGLQGSDIDEVRASCIQMQPDVGQKKTTQYGDILMDRPHRLYVGGLFVCETELAYGYNIKPEHLKLERDRQTVDSWDLKNMTKEMWFETGEWDFIAGLINNGVPDVAYAEYGSTEMVREACYRLFRQNNPGAIVAKDQKELKALVAAGMEKVVVVREVMYSNVARSESYIREPRVRIVTPAERLQAWYDESKFNMHDKVKRSFKELIDEAKHWRAM